MSVKHKERDDVYAVLRADLFHDAGTPLETVITVKEVVRSEDVAKREVERLNALHPDGRVRYWYQHSASSRQGAQRALVRRRHN